MKQCFVGDFTLERAGGQQYASEAEVGGRIYFSDWSAHYQLVVAKDYYLSQKKLRIITLRWPLVF
eukprot:scaffold183166_cov14-Prasinocladus_malaysianus.AAC.1